MATSFSVGDLLTVKLYFNTVGVLEHSINVLHYQVKTVSGAPATLTAGLAAIASGMHAEWGDAWKMFGAADVALVNASCTNVFPLPRSVQVFTAAALPIMGTIAGESLPMQDCITILKKSDVGNRWGTGRIFITGIPELVSQSGKIIPGGETNAVDLVDIVKSNIVVTDGAFSVTLAPVIVSGKDSAPARVTPITTSRLSDNIIKTQRRRRPGKGS